MKNARNSQKSKSTENCFKTSEIKQMFACGALRAWETETHIRGGSFPGISRVVGISVYRAKVREEVSGYRAKRGRRFQVTARSAGGSFPGIPIVR